MFLVGKVGKSDLPGWCHRPYGRPRFEETILIACSTQRYPLSAVDVRKTHFSWKFLLNERVAVTYEWLKRKDLIDIFGYLIDDLASLPLKSKN